MAEFAYTQAVEDELQDLHRGLHYAMDQLLNRQDYDESEKTLRIIDQRLSHLINRTTVSRVR